MNNTELIDVCKKMTTLHEKHPDYTSLSITLGFNNGVPYEKWNIYTPIILYNDFPSAMQLADFMGNIIMLGDDRYNAYELKKAERELNDLTERVEEIKGTIARLKEEKEEGYK